MRSDVLKKIIDAIIYLLERADPFITKYFKIMCSSGSNKLAILLAGLGGTLVTGAFLPQWFPFAAATFEQKLGINLSGYYEPLDKICLGVGILLILLAVWLFILNRYFEYKEKDKPKTKNLLLLQHNSIEGVVDFSSVKDDLKDYNITPLLLDQRKAMERVLETGIDAALDEQKEYVNAASVFITKGAEFKAQYMGLAHIPLVFLLGYQLTDKFNPEFYEWNQTVKTWEKVPETSYDYPSLKLYPDNEIGESHDCVDIAIKIGITYEIDDSDLTALGINFGKIFYLRLELPQRNAIKCVKQLNEYKAVFRDLLDKINQNYLNVKNIHIFCSAQTSLCFTLGSSLTERMDPTIFLYNHTRGEGIRYKWALKMQKRYRDANDIFIRLGGQTNGNV